MSLGIASVYLAYPCLHAGQADAVKDKLEKAKADCDAAIKRINKELLDALQKKEDAARAAGGKKLVDQVKEERDTRSRTKETCL
jgi:hypothetical protein